MIKKLGISLFLLVLDDVPVFGEDWPFDPLPAGAPEDGAGSCPAANTGKKNTAANSTEDIALILMT